MGNKNYCAGDYKTMTIHEKIDFLHQVHISEISLWDEYGNDNDIYNDYHTVEKELRTHPELFCIDDIVRLMFIINDDCFEPSWQCNLVEMILNIARFHGKDGICFLLQNLINVHETGRFHGWHFAIQWLMDDDSDYLLLEEALSEQKSDIKKLVFDILQSITVERNTEKKYRLKKIIDM